MPDETARALFCRSPTRPRTGLITYDAKDPDTKFPPIEQLRPPKGAPNILIILIDDVGFGAVERLRRSLPDAERRDAGGERAEVQPLSHDGAVLADAPGAADRPQPPLGRHGRHHRDRHRLARLLLGAAQHDVADRQDAEAERLRHGAVRQVPRSAGVGDQPRRPVRRLAHRRRRLRVLLRLHRRRGASVVSRRSTRAPRRSK